MAKLTSLPEQTIINGFKGTIDFYVWMGIPCARKWPRKIGPHRSPGVQEQWQAWSYITKAWSFLTPAIQEAYQSTVQGTNLSARDLFTKNYLSPEYLELAP